MNNAIRAAHELDNGIIFSTDGVRLYRVISVEDRDGHVALEVEPLNYREEWGATDAGIFGRCVISLALGEMVTSFGYCDEIAA